MNIHNCSPTPDIIVFTETWLSNHVADAELGLCNYNIYRLDRSDVNSFHLRGGGVLIAVISSLLSSEYYVPGQSVEHLFVKIKLKSMSIIVGATYISQEVQKDVSIYLDHISTIENLLNNNPECGIALFGDYNLNNIKWTEEDPMRFTKLNYVDRNIDEAAQIIRDCSSSYGLKQYFPVHPAKGYTLDLLLSDLEFKTIDSPDFLVNIDSHHPPAFFEVQLSSVSTPVLDNVQFNFKNINYDIIKCDLDSFNWSDLLTSRDINKNVDTFYTCLNSALERHVPKRRCCNSVYPRWYTNDLKNLIKEKKSIHRLWKIYGFQSDYIEFKRLRAKCIRMSKLCLASYTEKVESYLHKNSKTFWSYINSFKNNNDLPMNMYLDNENSSDSCETSELFCKFFKSTYNNHTIPVVAPTHCLQLFEKITVTESEISKVISIMGDSLSSGPDFIPSTFVKNSFYSLIQPLQYLYNQSLSAGILPNAWKRSFTTPIFKSGSRQDISNYRPISIINCFAKILDALVTDKLSEFLLPRIIDDQHGFVKLRSTVTNLLLFSNFITQSLENGEQVDAIYLDYSKAFDSVNHARLLSKLFNYGIRGKTLSWISSFLSNRVSFVKIKGSISSPYSSPSGVPQGSHLGPLLFIAFINDIKVNITSCQIILYADDVKIYTNVKSLSDSQNLQRDLNNIIIWSQSNGLALNIKKCHVISFYSGNFDSYNYSIGSCLLDRVSSIKDLGVIFDSKFTFRDHIDFVTSKALRMFGFICRNTRLFQNARSIITLFKSLILPSLTYASVIWSPYHNNSINKLESVQHRFLRHLSYRFYIPMHKFDHDYGDVSRYFGLPTIKSIHCVNDITFLYKLLVDYNINGELLKLFEFKHYTYSFRQIRQLKEYHCKLDCTLHGATFRLRRLWNSLDINMSKISNLYTLKNHVKASLLKFY